MRKSSANTLLEGFLLKLSLFSQVFMALHNLLLLHTILVF
jgi:hypothetical protein